MASSAVKIIRNFNLPKEVGFHHRLICMTGESKGLSYFLVGKRVVLGRGVQADIQILDAKSSREHAELALVGNQYILSDLGSQNGVIINDLKVGQHALVDNDKIIIGSTVFKYNHIEVKEKLSLETVEDEEEDDDDDEDGDDDREKKKSKGGNDKANKKKRIYIMAIALVAVFFLLEDEPEQPKPTKKKERSLSSINVHKNKNSHLTREVRKKLESVVHRGRRELREQNFFRAIEQFNLALTIDPRNGEASFLLKKSQQGLDDLIKKIAKKAANEIEQKRYRGSLLQWCEIVRYLRNYPEDKRYKDAEKQVDFLTGKLGYEKDEYKCF